MGAQLERTPPDLPAIDTPETRINIRKALAGLYLLQGRGSMKRCLIDAGYSRATARLVTQNGLSAQQCLNETAKLDSTMSPAKLLEGGRRVLAEQIAFRDPNKMATRDAVLLFTATEKFFGGHEISPSNVALSVADRLSQLVSLMVVARERGLPIPALQPPAIEAKVLKEERLSTSMIERSPDGSTR